jgi:hypothetical protein
MESEHDLAGGLTSKERERPSFPRVEGEIEVVSSTSDPLDDQFLVVQQSSEVILRLSGGDVQIAFHLVKVDAGRLAEVSSHPISGRRHREYSPVIG